MSATGRFEDMGTNQPSDSLSRAVMHESVPSFCDRVLQHGQDQLQRARLPLIFATGFCDTQGPMFTSVPAMMQNLPDLEHGLC